jgi:hypothetical protein
MMNKKIAAATLLLLAIATAWNGCREEITVVPGDLPLNPYDTLTYPDDEVPEIPVDSNSFLGIHQYILTPKCAVSACHDGSFEPDYRTLNSAYNTLVYAPVIKNTIDSFYTYRVVPFDTSQSWLWYRLTKEDQVLGQMPLYDVLPVHQQIKIRNWIQQGAPDVFGNSPDLPKYSPALAGMVAYLPSQGYLRVDTMRGGIITNPFMVPQNEDVEIWFAIYDDITFPYSFTYNKVKYSTEAFDFSAAGETDLELEIVPKIENLFGFPLPFFAHCTINTSQFNINDIVYLRVYVQDGDHTQPAELPDNGTQLYLISFFSFIVQ